jgi:tRNA (uracil-5-)-methyltransferase/23S rRNA (uracil1939-C5)-methyltransferase
VPPEARVAEFYAGCGAIGLGLVRRGHEVRFNERGDASLGGLARGIAALGEDDANATVHPGAAGDHVGLIDDSDVVIVDPPRKGLEDALLTRLRDAPPERLIYVACGLQSFLRDARALLEGGRMALTRVRPYDLFPFTEHIETLAVFDRRDSSCPTRDSVLRTARA